MRAERAALRAGHFLISLACRRLPPKIRQERYDEWAAELPVILHDPGAGPAPVRVVRMLAFAADTLRGVALAPETYRGAHRGPPARNTAGASIRWLGTGLLLLGALLACVLVLVAYEGWIVYHLTAGPTLSFGGPLVLINLVVLAASRIPRWASPVWRWYAMSNVVAGTGLSLRAIANSAGWGHPLLFAIIGCCADAISVVCLGLAVRCLFRPQHAHISPE